VIYSSKFLIHNYNLLLIGRSTELNYSLIRQPNKWKCIAKAFIYSSTAKKKKRWEVPKRELVNIFGGRKSIWWRRRGAILYNRSRRGRGRRKRDDDGLRLVLNENCCRAMKPRVAVSIWASSANGLVRCWNWDKSYCHSLSLSSL